MNKKLLNRAFRDLNKNGFIAKQNFSCCQSCGSYEIANDNPGEPYVFYHRQDTKICKIYHTLHLAWSGDGNKIVEILKSNDLEVEWDGSETSRIKILF
jgi:hypothetical protein